MEEGRERVFPKWTSATPSHGPTVKTFPSNNARASLSLLHIPPFPVIFDFHLATLPCQCGSLFNDVSTQNSDRRNFCLLLFFFPLTEDLPIWPVVKESRSVARAPLARMRGGHQSLTAQRRACRCVRALFATMALTSMPCDRPVTCLEARDARSDDQSYASMPRDGMTPCRSRFRRRTVVATLSRATYSHRETREHRSAASRRCPLDEMSII